MPFKKLSFVYALFALLLSGTLFIGSSGGVADVQGLDRTGSPVSSAPCSQCHSGGSFSASASLTITDGLGNVVTSYNPGLSYTLTYTISASGASAYAMQATALLSNNAAAGSISSPSANAQVSSLNSRQYLEHASQSTSNTFTATWTAPSTGAGSITFYGSALAINFNGNSSGDQYVNIPNVTLTEQSSGPSSDASLSDLQSGGQTVPNFSSSTLSYNIQLPAGTTTVPTVTATTNDPNASFVVTPASSLPGTTSVVVTAEDNSTTQTYSISYSLAPNTDATLSDLQSDGQTVPGFSSSDFSYDIQLPVGTTNIPTVTATTSDPNASAVITQATSLPGNAQVVVTAEDNSTSITYSISFTVLSNQTEAMGFARLQLVPNRVQSQLQLQVQSLRVQEVRSQLSNLQGQVIQQSSWEVAAGNSYRNWDVSSLAKGWYQLTLSTSTGQQSLRFFKY